MSHKQRLRDLCDGRKIFNKEGEALVAQGEFRKASIGEWFITESGDLCQFAHPGKIKETQGEYIILKRITTTSPSQQHCPICKATLPEVDNKVFDEMNAKLDQLLDQLRFIKG